MAPRRPSKSLTKDDIDRLRYATGRRQVDLERSLFDPNGLTWRINRESALVLGGGCALLLQIAHPLVAAGVEQHSNFRANPLQRLWRTLDLMGTVVFGTAKEAMDAIRTIERRHAPVGGVLGEEVGRFPSSTTFHANDPGLQFWVHATLVDTALRIYERIIEPLTEAERRRYYEESKITARLFGIPTAGIPETWPRFREYWDEMIEGEHLAVGAAGRAVAESILTPPLPLGLREVLRIPHIFTLGLLPPRLREAYGYSWSLGHETLLWAAFQSGGTAIPWLPSFVRFLPRFRRAVLGTEEISPLHGRDV